MDFYKQVKKYVESIGGTVRVESMTVGHGTSENVFIVEAPYVKPKVSKKDNKILTMEQLLKDFKW